VKRIASGGNRLYNQVRHASSLWNTPREQIPPA
jgi:hypothetical protein